MRWRAAGCRRGCDRDRNRDLTHARPFLLPAGQVTRTDAEARLQAAGAPEGGFILRSKGPEHFVITVTVDGQPKHHSIARQLGGQAFVLNGCGPGIGLTVEAAVRSVLLLNSVEVVMPIFPDATR